MGSSFFPKLVQNEAWMPILLPFGLHFAGPGHPWAPLFRQNVDFFDKIASLRGHIVSSTTASSDYS